MIDKLIDETVAQEFDREQIGDLESHIENLLEIYRHGDVTGLLDLIRVSHLLHRDFRIWLVDEIGKHLKGELTLPTEKQLSKKNRNLAMQHFKQTHQSFKFPGQEKSVEGQKEDDIIGELMEKYSLCYDTIKDLLKKKEG